MALDHAQMAFGITDAAVSVLTADPEGGAATYAAPVDVPGITKVSLDIEISSQSLRGDGTVIDERSEITAVTGSIEYSRIGLGVLAALLGGSVTDGGVTPDQVAAWSLTKDSRPVPFMLQGATASTDTPGGDHRVEVYKCILTGVTGAAGGTDQEYTKPALSFRASPRRSDGEWANIEFRETAAAASAA